MTILSIIIPVYKVEPYLRECLDSVAASPLDCWEAILIDDGSPDGCPQICDEYAAKDSRFSVIHQENAGVAAARNAGLDAAKGEWIWFVDSDDVVDMRPVAGMVEWLKQNEDGLQFTVYSLQPDENQNQNEKVDLVMFGLDTFDDNETLTLRKATGRRTKFGNDTALRNTALRNADATKTIGWNDNQNESQNENQDQNRNEKVAERFVAKRFVAQRFVDKKDFLSQHISFFHQQFWYRNGNENENQNGGERIHFTEGIRVAEDLERMYKYFTVCQQPVKFEATLYHYRVRKTSVTQDENYRKKAVEDLPVVLNHLAEWIRRNDIKPEPWIDMRIMKLFQNLLYSASLINEKQQFDIGAFQNTVRGITARYRSLDFCYINKMRYRLAALNVKVFFLINRTYLALRGND